MTSSGIWCPAVFYRDWRGLGQPAGWFWGIRQFQNITGTDIEQLKDTKLEAILSPAEYKTGTVTTPYPTTR